MLATPAYLPGVKALLNSLKQTGTQADLVVLHTDELDGQDLATLDDFDCRLVRTPQIPVSDGFQQRHARDHIHATAPFRHGRKPEFHRPLANFCKLRLWQLRDYRACVFLDADAIVLRNIDRLFDYPEFCAAPNVYETLNDFHRLNSGVFTARPSKDTFAAMTERLDAPGAFWRRTDQTFLETFFPDWHGLPVFFNMLQYVWFNLPDLWDWNSVHVIHFQYEKPWETDHPKADRLRPLIDLWRTCHDGAPIPPLDTLPPPPGAGEPR